MFSTILVVCTGNICRSPMAEGLLAARWATGSRRVSSAGIHALVGEPAQPHAVDVMREKGLDISGHRARQAGLSLIREADLVLVMEAGQADWILSLVPTARGKVQMMTRFADAEFVHDPYMQDREAYLDCYELLDDCVTSWLERI